jgi:hypothetical protein
MSVVGGHLSFIKKIFSHHRTVETQHEKYFSWDVCPKEKDYQAALREIESLFHAAPETGDISPLHHIIQDYFYIDTHNNIDVL